MPRPLIVATVVLSMGLRVATASAADPAVATLERSFTDTVQPFLTSYCLGCHGEKKQEGKLDLHGYSSHATVIRQHGVWELVLERLEAGEMPPDTARRQPRPEERRAVIEWIHSMRDAEARRNAGDPGPVLARRLSNSEFDYTIRDLTGVDIRPTKEFPVDPANAAGFDNTGESLAMSPALVKKYVAAARLVADHIVLKPNGFVFAPHPVVAETDRDKYCVQRIVDFYQQHRVEYARYFHAAWQFQHRAALGKPKDTLAGLASRAGLSPRYLATIWTALTETAGPGPLGDLRNEWKELPNPLMKDDKLANEDAVRGACEQLRDFVLKQRKSLDSKVEKIHIKGNSDGSQPLVLWWNRQIAAQRMTYLGDGQDAAQDAARRQFCRVFPNTFAVTSRGHYADPNLGAQVRLLTAGFHLMQGYFRDDTPLCELVLDDTAKQDLDELWRELNFVTLVPIRQYKDFLFFERAEPPRFAGGPEFDFARPEDKDVTSEAKLTRMRDAYLAKARKHDASPQAIDAIETYFANMAADFRWIEQAHRDAEPSHLESLMTFAEQAYRRPLASAERDELLAFYRSLRGGRAFRSEPAEGDAEKRQPGKSDPPGSDGLSHEDAIRDCVVSVLLSPHFCYRFDLAPESADTQPLSDYALASRLSYFLWSSMPDTELLTHAAHGDLRQPDVLVQQARRMLRDPRARALAVEFAGNWLDFRRFEEHNSVDRERFASFTNELREAMFEEPLRFFEDVIRENRSVLDFLYADHTFVNPMLARHYGINLPDGAANEWVRIDEASRYGRGGLLPMSVFLTKNSPGLRTSPVKRGYWVVRRLLGEHIPAPPPEVPELPKDEAQLGDLTLPQLLARHREHKSCAACHVRFDSIGLVFEGYGPIGERREKDLGNHPVQTKAIFPDGSEGDGLPGLKQYLQQHREQEFVDNLCRKMLAYALGRGVMLSDQQTLDTMRKRLVADGHHFNNLVEVIVTSPQFLNKRGGAVHGN